MPWQGKSFLLRSLDLSSSDADMDGNGANFFFQAMLLRRVEATLILTLLSISLGRSSVPRAPSAATTGPRIYACMVNILTSLVRLRQDVLLPHLPHLTAVLAQLAGLFRVLRHNLGGAQVQAVANTLPCWLDVHAPLGEAEARAYARLLTSLTIKSAPLSKAFRSTTGPGARGAESLARPFSAHAVYVLVAYVRALVVPLTTVPTGVRRELMPGLFALCDLVGEHARASAMVSMLDAGGKTLFRKLWRDWEKQRYRGQ